MSTNRTAYTTLIFLIILGVAYFYAADSLALSETKKSMDPSYFPKLLAVLLIILCAINIFQIRKKEDKKIEVPNIRKILTTIGLTILYFVCWGLLGFFYLFTFIYLFLLFNYYKQSKRHILLHFGIAIVFVLFIYVVFDVFLNIRF